MIETVFQYITCDGFWLTDELITDCGCPECHSLCPDCKSEEIEEL